MQIATSRYLNRQAIEESGLAPVATSVGRPRFRLGYELAASVGMLAPHGLRHVDDEGEFTPRYRERLDRFGVEAIRQTLAAIADGAGAPGVVLLCFEDVAREGVWCHRRVFAAYWRERTGQEVREL